MSEQSDFPAVVDPWMVVAFEGWNDAAEAATEAVDHLIEWWDAELVAELDPDDYYDYQVNRPYIGRDDDGERSISWPTTRVFVARPVGSDRDVLLVRGLEPNMRWLPFCDELLMLADRFSVRGVVTLGALLADTPHTRPIPVTGSTSDADLAARLHVEESQYEGPTGINGVFTVASSESGLPTVSLWAAVPHYVAQAPSPKATLALLGYLEDILEISLPLGDLRDLARAWERGVEELASSDSEIAAYVESLEEARDTSELPEASGDAIAREFERYLKRRSRDTDT
ncbi:PAC2 family protein [Mumia sp. DW29H23]|uniref:PAC2 family protein n=1 Tax=Mumia sp. DW29H23 TaxID=3421241 RepID=UPI003D69DE73